MASGETKRTNLVNDTNRDIAAMTNQANKDIAMSNNEFNLQMLDKQIAYNKEAYQQQYKDQIDFWNMQNEYNSPENQMQRLRDAGINPYVALGSVTSGTSSGSVSASMGGINPPTATPYQAVGYTAQKPDVPSALGAISSVLSTLNNASKNLAEIPYIGAQTQGMSIQNQYVGREMAARIGSILAGAQGQDLQNKYQGIVNQFTPALMTGQLTQQNLQNIGYSISNAISDMQLNFLPLEQKMQLGMYAADLRNKYLQGNLTEKQIKSEIARYAGMFQDNRGKKFNADQQERLKEYLDNTIMNASTPNLTNNPIGFGKAAVREAKRFVGSPKDQPFVWWLPSTW